MKTSTLDDKTSLILSLIKLANVDGKVQQFEQMYIGSFTNTLGVSASVVNSYKENLDKVPVVPPDTKEEKIEYFWRILSLMKMDLTAHEEEIKLCRELGVALGIPEHEVNGFVDFMVENVNRFIKLEDFEAQLSEILKNPKYQPKESFLKRLFSIFTKKNKED